VRAYIGRAGRAFVFVKAMLSPPDCRRFALRELAFQMFRFGLVGLVNAGVDAAVFFTMVAILAAFAPDLSHEW
jgi:hypothetical protein